MFSAILNTNPEHKGKTWKQEHLQSSIQSYKKTQRTRKTGLFGRFFHAGKWHLIKKRENLNRIHDLKERRKELAALLEAREKWLKEGWNPIIDPEFKLRKVKTTESNKELFLNDALDFAFEKKSSALKGKSVQDYRNQLNFLKEVAEKEGYSLLQIRQVDRGICLDLVDNCAVIRNFSNHAYNTNHAYNKYIGTLRSMFTELLDRRIVDVNPLHNYRAKAVPESNKYESFTEEEKGRIAGHLLHTHYNLYRVMQIVYHTGIRPKEVLALRVEDIDLTRKIITIAPDEKEENSKDNDIRRVPINPHLLDLLGQMNLPHYPESYFVFGSPFKPGQGNRGAGAHKWFDGIDRPGKEFGTKYKTGRTGAMREDFLMPSPNQVSRDTLTKLWQKLVKDGVTGLGIKKCLYAAKHTGTDDKIDAGLKLSELQIMYGHSSEAMTARYNKRKREIEASESIMSKSPDVITKGKLKKVA